MQWIALVIGLVLGGAVGYLIARVRGGQQTAALARRNEELQLQLARFEESRRAEDEKLRWVDAAQEQLRETFSALAGQALATNADQFINRSREQLEALLTQLRGDWGTQKEQLRNLVEPLGKTLEGMDKQVRAMEEKREGAYQTLEKHLEQLGKAETELRESTITLSQALRSSTVRGRWGELQLRRVLELAGMLAHVDFEEQVATDGGRPDVIVHLPNQGILPVDAKAPMAAYFEALEADGDARRSRLAAHAQAMRARIQELGRKAYWRQFERAPEMVIMFVPSEACLAAAFEQDPSLLEFGVSQHVLVTTPLTLLGLLRAVAYGFQQQEITENATQITRQGQELYDRVVRFLELFQRTGHRLGQTVDAYDNAVGSLEQRLLPAARRFKELNVASKDLPDLAPMNRTPRELTASEAGDEDD
jgi:DNA recombination protein RmuC